MLSRKLNWLFEQFGKHIILINNIFPLISNLNYQWFTVLWNLKEEPVSIAFDKKTKTGVWKTGRRHHTLILADKPGGDGGDWDVGCDGDGNADSYGENDN